MGPGANHWVNILLLILSGMWVIFNKFPPFIDIHTGKVIVYEQKGTTLKSLGIVATVS